MTITPNSESLREMALDGLNTDYSRAAAALRRRARQPGSRL